MINCSKYNDCSAPMCPYDKELKSSTWYPSEQTCSKPGFNWISNQRKIAKKTQCQETYYTFNMLNRNCIISKGMKGLDPEKEEGDQLKKWLEKRPEKRKLSDSERKKISKRLNSVS
ncbi:MAG: hypothetical protein JSW06_02855 [Thermoplasmatales archaeon]|nr:MAG: hypothetical protein JSW06_02855 [Thermoplasmatales archaeon]